MLFFIIPLLCISLTEEYHQPTSFKEYNETVYELEDNLSVLIETMKNFSSNYVFSIGSSENKTFMDQLEDLIYQTNRAVNYSRSLNRSVRIPLTMTKINYKKHDAPAYSQINFSYPGFFILGDNPELIYEPSTLKKNRPRGIIFPSLTHQSCEANNFLFTFYFNNTVCHSKEITIEQNDNEKISLIDGVDDFDLLHVTANSKDPNYTCIPNFVLFTSYEDN